ncbi:transposase [bacterium]|nr:transposase [bacterium]
MTTEFLIIAIFCQVDNVIGHLPRHSQAKLYPSELVTLALLYALKGGGKRAFYRWLCRDYLALFPHLPERTRLFRLFVAHQALARRFLAHPTVLGVIDSYGIELIHPVRQGRSSKQIGVKGTSNRRWIVGTKLCLLLNQFGLVVNGESGTANEHDSIFHALIARYDERMIVLSDTGFHAAEGDPANLKVCQPKTWGDRMVIETVLSMVTVICRFKQMTHRVWAYFEAHLSYAMALFNILVQWHGFEPDAEGFIALSMAEFSL